MLIDVTQRLLSLAVRHKTHTRLILLAVSTIFVFIRPAKYSLMSSESLYNQLDSSHDLLFSDVDREFEELPPHQTIFVFVDGGKEFCDSMEKCIKRIRLRSKSLKISTANSSEQYFVKLYVKESKETCLNIHPMRNYQPNSDIMELAKSVFEPRLLFEFGDLAVWCFENRIDISLASDQKSLRKLASLLRYYMNIESHAYGLYYYIPVKTGIIRAESLGIFMLLTLISSLSDFQPGCNPVMVLVAGILYHLCPLVCVFFLRKEHVFLYGLAFCVINFKAGFAYCLASYILMIGSQVRELLSRNQKPMSN